MWLSISSLRVGLRTGVTFSSIQLEVNQNQSNSLAHVQPCFVSLDCLFSSLWTESLTWLLVLRHSMKTSVTCFNLLTKNSKQLLALLDPTRDPEGGKQAHDKDNSALILIILGSLVALRWPLLSDFTSHVIQTKRVVTTYRIKSRITVGQLYLLLYQLYQAELSSDYKTRRPAPPQYIILTS